MQTIRSIVTKEDPTREYVTSSPSNGKLSEKENFIADNPYDPLYGDSKLGTIHRGSFLHDITQFLTV